MTDKVQTIMAGTLKESDALIKELSDDELDLLANSDDRAGIQARVKAEFERRGQGVTESEESSEQPEGVAKSDDDEGVSMRYVGDEGDGPGVVMCRGYRFEKDKPVSVDQKTAERLACNNHFERA